MLSHGFHTCSSIRTPSRWQLGLINIVARVSFSRALRAALCPIAWLIDISLRMWTTTSDFEQALRVNSDIARLCYEERARTTYILAFIRLGR